MEALGLKGVSKCTAAKRGCPTLVFRCRTGLDVEGGDAIGSFLCLVWKKSEGDVF